MAPCLYFLHNISVFFSSDSPLPVTSRVCFVKFLEPESVGVSQHLTNTVFVDRALIVVPFAEGGSWPFAPVFPTLNNAPQFLVYLTRIVKV